MILANFRPSVNELARVEHRWAEGAGFAEALTGRSAAAIGWIPAFQEPDQLPEGFLQDQWSRDSSIPLLLGSGNQAPPREFADAIDFQRHLNTLDYRAAICIARPTLYLNHERQPMRLHFDAIARVGCTAVRANPLLWYSAGVGMSSGEISADGGRITIRLFIRMKLGPLGQVVARLQTNHWPPWATMAIEYTFDLRDDISVVRYLGTRIPSLRRYVGWQLDSEYRIEHDLSAAAYEGFIEAGGCQDASAHGYSLWTPLSRAQVSDGR